MSPSSEISSGKRALSAARNFMISALTFIVFLILDFLDVILCVVFRFLDRLFEGKASTCFCQRKGNVKVEEELSESLYLRKNVFSEMCFLGVARKCGNRHEEDGRKSDSSRWSDCRCDSCLSWMKNINGDPKLYLCVLEPSQASNKCGKPACENVVFLHGYLSSSSFWTETVFPNLSEPIKRNHRLFAIDLLGFGRSPKPTNCLYTLEDHLKMIEKSVICPFQLDSFHLVAHSMGCIIAIALAARHSKSVKSITLVAPPVFLPEDSGAIEVLEKLAKKQLWPPLSFGTAVMSWYEHINRCFCFLVCRNHRTLGILLKILTQRSVLPSKIVDLARHTHNSSWYSMHNVICGGSKFMKSYLEVLSEARVKICVVQAGRDKLVPIECCENIKRVAPTAQIDVVRDATHTSVVRRRQKAFTTYLENIWTSLADS